MAIFTSAPAPRRPGLIALLACLAACVSVDEGAPDDARPVATVTVADPLVTVGEFIGFFDPSTGTLAFEEVPIDEWLSVDTMDPDALRRVSQALYCEQRVTEGVTGTVSLTTVGGSIYTTAGDCGFPSNVGDACGDASECPTGGACIGGTCQVTFPYTITGAFCAEVGVTNHWTTTLSDVVAEMVTISPPDFAGYEFPLGTGYDPGALPAGLDRPSDASGGLFYHGDIGAGAQSIVRWMFRNPVGAFFFRGRIMARMTEIANDADDNCDEWVDDRLNEYADEADCRFNEDCISGLCHDIDGEVVPEPVGDCAETCLDGYYGDPCGPCPGLGGSGECNGNGTCDDGAAGTGVCACNAGFAGTECALCDTGYYGPSCDPCPTCENGGVCDEGMAGSGACDCPTGVHGPTCNFTCSDGDMNGDETGVDCGGATCASCPPGETEYHSCLAPDITPGFNPAMLWFARVDVPAPTTIRRLGLDADGTYAVKIGLYDGGTAGPANLLTSGAGTVSGLTEIDVPDVLVAAGTYWVALDVEDGSSFPLRACNTSDTSRTRINHTWSGDPPLPVTAPTYSSHVYWLRAYAVGSP